MIATRPPVAKVVLPVIVSKEAVDVFPFSTKVPPKALNKPDPILRVVGLLL